ncbi:MAG: hypothetical protein OXC28_17755 [Defluviicoccus sp.]|nr:hypothetical protein [Defluviicoccus sp.]
MNSANHKKNASALTNLLRAELRDARFSVTHLAHAHIQFLMDTYTGSERNTPQEPTRKELDARGLKALHQRGVWKQELFQSKIRVETLCRGLESAARREDFERLLDDFGVLSEGHIAHALGPLLPGYQHSTTQSDYPEKSIGVSTTADLWSYLLVDACLATPGRTANKVLRWVLGAPLAFETRVLLGRLNAASSFTLANGLAADRLPIDSTHLNGWFPTGFGVALSGYLNRTILRIPCRIGPVLSKPSKVIEHRDGNSVESWRFSANIEAAWPLQPGGVHELTRALSLVCDVAVETPMIWTDYGDHSHFGQRFGSSNSGSGEPPPRTSSESTLTADDLKQAIRLQPRLLNPSASVQTAFRYWLKSKSRRPDWADCMVSLRTALEALFLDRGNRAELTFRLATNGAWYTGRNSAERRQRYDVLRKVYAAASAAVHSGRVKSTEAGLLSDGQEICRLAILKRLRSGQDPVWEDIVFGR